MLYVINYANDRFKKQREYNTRTAYSKGKADRVIEFFPTDIDEDFKKANHTIFSYERGDGLWLWKPYIVYQTLEKINEGDYLFYCDAGAVFINKIQHLINSMEKSNQSVMLFELPLLERQFTKKEAYDLLNYQEYDNNQIMGSYLLCRKCNTSISFIKKWLDACCDERLLSPKKFNLEIKEFEDFYQHREDQSVLSILAHKENIAVFRDPSHYGNRPWEYTSNNWKYNPKTYKNSHYPKILVSNRGADPVEFRRNERIKTFLNKIGIYNQRSFNKKFGIKKA